MKNFLVGEGEYKGLQEGFKSYLSIYEHIKKLTFETFRGDYWVGYNKG
jgi:hypothetical protein